MIALPCIFVFLLSSGTFPSLLTAIQAETTLTLILIQQNVVGKCICVVGKAA